MGQTKMDSTDNTDNKNNSGQGEQREQGERRRPGPVPGPPTRKYNILLDEELAEWGKQQPGGLSELLRRLLKAEREKG
jgi:hypothetical protein